MAELVYSDVRVGAQSALFRKSEVGADGGCGGGHLEPAITNLVLGSSSKVVVVVVAVVLVVLVVVMDIWSPP